ncbi:MAG: hypothetical protein VW270_13040 [Candidatus Poseidoniales archaeon]
MKRWIEVSPYSGLEEDAPANNASSGDVAMPPDAVMVKKKKKRDALYDARTKAYREHRAKLEAARAARAAKKESKFVKSVTSEMAYGAGYDTAKPMAALNAQKSATGYDLYHKTFSGAMQHAYKFAKSKGYTVQPSEIDSKVASGPRKPSSGKTNSYILDTDKKQRVHIQVANLDNKRYELNMYIT